MDLIWISSNYNMYNNSVFKIQKSNIKLRIIPAILAYILLILNILFILIPYSKTIKSFGRRLAVFALSGAVIYGVYNATSLSILNEYTFKIAILDSLWGLISHTILFLLIEYL
jgi:uncharacterized membrane protein